MAGLARLLLVALLVGTSYVFGWLGTLGSIDTSLLDARFALTSRAPSDGVVVVEIDSRSLAAIGVWPWPRSIHARLLDKLMALDASDVAFDVDFSSASNPVDDAAFAAALERAGGFAWLAALEQNSGAEGSLHLNLPLPQLRAFADPVDVNVRLDPQGRVVSFPASVVTPEVTLPSLAEALTGTHDPGQGTILIDFGIDLRQIDRVSAADLLDGKVDPTRIAGRQVIVGASAIELRDQFTTPRFGLVSGALVQAEALETVKANRGLRDLGSLPALGLVLLLAGLAAGFGGGIDPVRLGIVAAGSLVGVEAIALLLQAAGRVVLDTAPADLAILLLAALALVGALREEYQRRRAAQNRLAYLARHDAVTGVLSRQGLVEALGAPETRLTILLVGIRRLDLVRGALGHDVADVALQQVAARLSGLAIARLALVDRDTFALAWDGPVDRDEIDQHCDRVTSHLEPGFEAAGHSVFVDPVYGAATGRGVEIVLRQAELALADGLRTGRTGAFSPVMEARVVLRRRVDTALRKAVESGGIDVQFQPQVSLADGRMVGVEALARWDDPELGPVSPGEFIPLAEETGLIVRLGELVMREACRRAALWRWDGRLAVNVSAAQIQLGDVVGIVDRALADSGFPVHRLDVEVTESLLVERRGQAAAQLAALRARGIGLAIDDFGTGYSSLSYVAELDWDKLKIDRSFVLRMAESAAGASVVQTIVDLAHRLGKTVVVEGIETARQRALLTAMGCDFGQGFLFGKAVAASAIAERVGQERDNPVRAAV